MIAYTPTPKDRWQQAIDQLQRIWKKLSGQQLKKAKGDCNAIQDFIWLREGDDHEDFQRKMSDPWVPYREENNKDLNSAGGF